MPSKYKSVEERFWAHVHKTEGCWNWTAAVRGAGYGAFLVNQKNYGAHRFSYLLTKGEIPKGLCVLHACDNRRCVNPAHLSLGTNKDNTADMISKGRGKEQKKTHCKNGHAFTPENTFITPRPNRPSPERVCLICVKERKRKYEQLKGKY